MPTPVVHETHARVQPTRGFILGDHPQHPFGFAQAMCLLLQRVDEAHSHPLASQFRGHPHRAQVSTPCVVPRESNHPQRPGIPHRDPGRLRDAESPILLVEGERTLERRPERLWGVL